MPRALLVLSIGLLVPIAIQAQEGNPPRLDRSGDPLPVGALSRLGTLRFHNCGCAAYSPDGKTIVTANGDELTLWDTATSKKIRQLKPEKQRDTVGLMFSHDGKKLAAIGWGGTSIHVYDLETFNKVRLIQAEGGSAGGNWDSAAAFSSDDKTLVAATAEALFVWDVATGKKLAESAFSVMGNPVHVRMISVSEDGKVAATQDEKKIHLWDTQTGKLLHEVEMNAGETMKFSRDGKSLVVSGRSFSRVLNVVSVETGKKIHSLKVSEGVQSLAFSPDGKTLAAASNATIGSSSTTGDQLIQLWDLANLQAPPVKFQAPGIHYVRISPDGKTLAWGCHGTLCFMDCTGKDLQPVASHRGAIKSLLYLPDGKRVVSASVDGTIRIWDTETGESLNVLQGHIGEISGLALFPNGKLLASCGRDGTFRLWDIDSGKSLAVLNDEGNSVVAAAFSADGKRLASGGYRGITFLRDSANGKILDEIETNSVRSLAFAPDGKTLAILLDHEKKLLLYDLGTKKLKELPVKRDGSSVAYSPDGKMLVVGGNEHLLLFDTTTNREMKRLPGHWNSRGCVVFSPDGYYLASVSDGYHGPIANRTVRVFEVASGTEIHSFKKELPIFAAAFSPDGSKLVSGGTDATAVVLDLRNLTGKNRREKLTETELSDCWKSLATVEASKAYDARLDLLHAPKSAVPFLAKSLEPAPVIDVKRVAGLIKKLDSVVFQEREDATAELALMGELIREPLRAAMAAGPSAEAQPRLQTLLSKLEHFTPSQLRNLRAIEILEGIGTPEAIQIIEQLTRGNELGLLTAQSRAVLLRRKQKSLPLPEIPNPQTGALSESIAPGPILPDLAGDPMPAGAIARLGTTRWRLAGEPRRIILSTDGKMLAVVNNYSSVELLDAQTGRNIERAGSGSFGFGFDMRMSVALSADCRRVAAMEVAEQSRGVLAVHDRGKAENVKIEYGRKKEAYPDVPEELAGDGGFSSTSSIEYLSAAAFSPDGKTLVGSVRFEWEWSGNKASKKVKESHVIAWDAATGKELWKSPALEKAFNTIVFAPNGKTITVVDQGGIGFWDADTGKERTRWQSKDPLFSACCSPDRSWLATGSKEEVLLWEVATGKVVRRLAIPGPEIKAIAFSSDGNLIAGGGDKTIRFWDVLTGKSRGDCSAFPNPVQAVAFSSDGKTLFSGHEQENALRRWGVADRKPSGEFTSPISPTRMLSFSRDSRKILASAAGEEVYLWEAETGNPCPLPKKDEDRFLNEFFASSGQTSLLRCEDGFGQQFVMMLTGKIDRLDQIPGFVGSSVDGRRVLLQSQKDKMPCFTVIRVGKGFVKENDKRKDDIEREIVWKDGDEVNAALSPDGKTVAAAGKDVVCFFDVMTGEERRYQHPTNVEPEKLFRIQSDKFSSDGSRIALVGSEGKIRVLAVKDGRKIAELATKSRNASGLAFSPDGQTLLTASFSAPTYAWEVATGQMVRKLEPATYFYSPDNRLLAGFTGTLKVFDLYSGRVIRECKAESGIVGNFAFSPNSKLLAAGCSDTTITIWPASPADTKLGKPLDEKGLAEVLENGEATDAYAAIGRLIADPERSITFLEGRLRSAPKADAKEAAISAEEVLHIRAIQALERIGTPRARQLLDKISQGAETSPRTRAAVEALLRLDAR